MGGRQSRQTPSRMRIKKSKDMGKKISNGRMILKQRIVMSWTNGVIENEYVLLDDRGDRSLRKRP